VWQNVTVASGSGSVSGHLYVPRTPETNDTYDADGNLLWIAQHLEMGSWTRVSNLLGAKRKQESLKSED
jgi:hypothetical protein